MESFLSGRLDRLLKQFNRNYLVKVQYFNEI